MKKATMLLIAVIVLLLFVVVLATKVNAKVFNDYGMELSIAGLTDIAPGCQDPSYNFNWARVSLFGKHVFNNNWDIGLYGNIGYLWWTAKEDDPNKETFSLGADLILYRKVYKTLSLGVGGGFATLSNRNNLPDLGSSGLYGTITGRLRWAIMKQHGMEFAIDHISDALQDGNDGDGGKNVIALKYYFMFN